VRGLAGLAVGVELLGQVADALVRAGVRPVSSSGKGKVSKQRDLL
jgi:hypothetical protein